MRNKASIERQLAALLAGVVLVSACGGDDDGGGGTADARPATIDASTVDADPNAPDADPTTPDADLDIDASDSPDAAPGQDDDIRDIQNGVIATGSTVRMVDVVVTARRDTATSSVIFVQEPEGAPERSGVFIFVDLDPAPAFELPTVGDLVTVDGTVNEFTRTEQPGSRTNVDPVTNLTINGSTALPTPVSVTSAGLVFGQPGAENYQGVLVRVASPTVQSADMFGEFTLVGGLKVDDRLFTYVMPFAGDTYTSITGVVDHDFGTTRLLPRDEDDMPGYTAAAPILTSLTPGTASITQGETGTFGVGLNRAAPAGGTVITLSSDASGVVSVPASVTVPQGATAVTFDASGVGGGSTQIHASLGAVTLNADVTVLVGGPGVASVGPSGTRIAASGGTGLLTVTLDTAAPAGGAVVTLTSSAPASVAVPAQVEVPAGATSVRFRVRGDAAGAASATITAAIGESSATTTVTTLIAVSAPTESGELVLNEIFANPGTAMGDAGCDGTSNSTADEFVEIVNVTNGPLALGGVEIIDATNAARHVFAARILGPGEAILVFGAGPIGTSTTAPWCLGATATSIGGTPAEIASEGSGLALNNTNETVTLRIGATVLDTFTYAASTVATSVTRAPDDSGTMTLHTAAAGHATDRGFTPGMLLTGAARAAAVP